jgi:hypothetical protein
MLMKADLDEYGRRLKMMFNNLIQMGEDPNNAYDLMSKTFGIEDTGFAADVLRLSLMEAMGEDIPEPGKDNIKTDPGDGGVGAGVGAIAGANAGKDAAAGKYPRGKPYGPPGDIPNKVYGTNPETGKARTANEMAQTHPGAGIYPQFLEWAANATQFPGQQMVEDAAANAITQQPYFMTPGYEPQGIGDSFLRGVGQLNPFWKEDYRNF